MQNMIRRDDMEMYIVRDNSRGVVRIKGELPDVSDTIQYYSMGIRLFIIQKNTWGREVLEYNIEDGTWNVLTPGKSNRILGKLNPENMISKEDMLKEIEKMRMICELRK